MLDMFQKDQAEALAYANRVSGGDLPTWYELQRGELVALGVAVALMAALYVIVHYRRQVLSASITAGAVLVLALRSGAQAIQKAKAVVLTRADDLRR